MRFHGRARDARAGGACSACSLAFPTPSTLRTRSHAASVDSRAAGSTRASSYSPSGATPLAPSVQTNSGTDTTAHARKTQPSKSAKDTGT
eukprot:181826-Rhodomonas_salina.3